MSEMGYFPQEQKKCKYMKSKCKENKHIRSVTSLMSNELGNFPHRENRKRSGVPHRNRSEARYRA